MLKKRDLVKEFELVVQQEIKNHNDRILESNQAIEGFKNSIKEISDRFDKKIALINSSLVSKESNISFCNEENLKIISELKSRINDFSKIIDEKIKSVSDGLKKRESYFLTIEGFKEFEKKLEQWQALLKQTLENQKKYIADLNKSTADSCLLLIKEIKSNIDEKINELNGQTVELNKSLDISAVNNSGLVKEIDGLKRRCFILEKNIENIYTQIERIKEDK